MQIEGKLGGTHDANSNTLERAFSSRPSPQEHPAFPEQGLIELRRGVGRALSMCVQCLATMQQCCLLPGDRLPQTNAEPAALKPRE